MVPEGWRLGTVEEIAKVTSGGTPSRKTPDYWGGSIPWVTTAEVDFGGIKSVAQYITEAGLDNSSAKLFPAGTILMAMYGQGKTRGKVAKLEIEASTNQACAALLLHKEYEKEFYYQYLASRYDFIRELANSGGQDNLSAGIVKSIQVPIPPLVEQRKIAKILSTWDEAIATTEQLLANGEQQKKVLMQQLLTGKKRLPGFEGEWHTTSLGSVAKIYQPKTISQSSLTADGYPVYGANGRIGFYSEYNHEYEQVAVTCRGSTCGAVNWTQRKSWITGNAMVVNVDDNYGVDKKFIYYLLCNSNLGYLVSGSGQPQITGDIRNHQIEFPEKAEQQSIASVISSSDLGIEILRRRTECLKTEKKALMQQLLTGKRRVKVDEAQAEAASA